MKLGHGEVWKWPMRGGRLCTAEDMHPSLIEGEGEGANEADAMQRPRVRAQMQRRCSVQHRSPSRALIGGVSRMLYTPELALTKDPAWFSHVARAHRWVAPLTPTLTAADADGDMAAR
eukprot:scaffold32936_cov129-Isochrysis_galbana.AAC.6